MSGSVEKYNKAFAGDIALITKRKLAIMYSPKCASAKILYWWLEKINLLPAALRFSPWSHDFETIYRFSEEYIRGSLSYDPRKWQTYKFVRHPVSRAISSFTHFLAFPKAFGVPLGDTTHVSFLRFLDYLSETDLIERDAHCRMQITRPEKEGLISPVVLKLEDGRDEHLMRIERQFGLPASTFEKDPQTKRILLQHAKQTDARISAGPADAIKFGQVPLAHTLISREVVERIYQLYRLDFDAYGYEIQPHRSRNARSTWS